MLSCGLQNSVQYFTVYVLQYSCTVYVHVCKSIAQYNVKMYICHYVCVQLEPDPKDEEIQHQMELLFYNLLSTKNKHTFDISGQSYVANSSSALASSKQCRSSCLIPLLVSHTTCVHG